MVIKRITSDKYRSDCLEYFQALFIKAGYNYKNVIKIIDKIRIKKQQETLLENNHK